MTKRHVALTLNYVLLLALLLTSCGGGLPGFPTPTPSLPTPTSFQQSLPPALVETDPPLGSVIGYQSPITFYFNQPMNKASAESALTGLPAGTFTWNDEATLLFAPTEPYRPNTTLKFLIGSSLQSANGYGIAAPIELSFPVADYLRVANFLPKPDAEDVSVSAAIVASFNQPVVALGGDAAAQPPAFSIQPAAKGRGEWINTSTYIFYPEPALAGGTEYTVSLSPDLKTVTGAGLDGSGQSAWKFTTSKPRVIQLEPSNEQLLSLTPEIKLIFNQPMDKQSVETSFSFRGTEGRVVGKFSWNKAETEMTFIPEKMLARNVGYILNLGAAARSQGGLNFETDYGAVFTTYDNFAVTETKSGPGYTALTFNSLLPEADYETLVTVSPELENLQVASYGSTLNVYGDFVPDTNYVIEASARIKDLWGQSLGDAYKLNVRTPPQDSRLDLSLYDWGMAFVRPDEAVLYAQAVNVQNINTAVAALSLQNFFPLRNSSDNLYAYELVDAARYSQSFDLPQGGPSDVKIGLTQRNNQLLPGVYYVQLSSPQITTNDRNITLVVSSQVNLTFKLGATEAFVWAVDLPSQTPVANAPVTIYDSTGTALGSGMTDENGLWKGPLSAMAAENQAYAVLGAPGDEYFALASSQWKWGINTWDFGYIGRVRSPHTEVYMYTDRPIYRPGQTVYFRGVARQEFNGRYELPPINTILLQLQDTNGVQLSDFDMQLSPYGTFNGQFKLAEDAAPGYYTFQNSLLEFYFSFQVAEYRKPEINLSVDLSEDEIRLSEPAEATVNARYFFDAPAGDLEVSWTLYAEPDYFSLPDYRTGLTNTSWLDVYPRFGSGYLGQQIGQGTGRTTPQGTLSFELPTIPETEAGQRVTLEVTAQDESGFPVSARAEMLVHPADFYIGVHPEQWIGRADSPMNFEVYTVDWAKNASGDKKLTAEFKQVRWEKELNLKGFPSYVPVYKFVGSSDLVTAQDGKARLSFTPPTSGTYLLDISGAGTRTQTLVWVGGAGSAAWPDLPDQRLELTADRDSYKPGETASVFIPNPFPVNGLALVTVERGLVSRAEVITLSGSGREYSLALTEDDAPNIYVSVTVLGQGNGFRYGLVNLPVAPDALALNVQILSSPTQAGPRDEVTFDVQVTDHQGQPVQGEFSFSVVDLASLALAEPNAKDILPAFYSVQPLGIQTGLSLAAYTGRGASQPAGGGGGGGGETMVIREDFPDTAYWNPSLVTNSEGRGQVTLTLPDSLTTWQVDVRGLTVDTKVGQAGTQIVATKPFLIRPVTPRFLVSGDHVLMAAVVNNNTSSEVEASVSIQSEGFTLDEPDQATQQVVIPANGRARVQWWGTAGTEEAADLIFSVRTTGARPFEDAARPVWGALPIRQYTSSQAFVTGGVLREATSQQEVISLPRTYSPSDGGLDVELSPSLAGNLLSALEVMEVPDTSMSAESTVSYLLPNLEVYRALNGAGLSDPELSERVKANVTTSVSRLLSLQNEYGGWSWWGRSQESDPYISAYVFFGLLRAHELGIPVNEEALQLAGLSLSETGHGVSNDASGAELDESTFINFVLAHTNTIDETEIGSLYNMRERLSPSSRALLAYILSKANPADERVRDLISNLEASAILTSSGAHWETPRENIFITGSPIYTTSLVVYVLAQLDSANPVVFNAVRYLAAHRNVHGLWGMGHDNAWAMLALNEAMIGFGDLKPDFAFHAMLNGAPLANGDTSGNQVLAPTKAQVPLEYLAPTSPNLLTIQREAGLGRLYYRAVLNLSRPVEDVKPLNAGLQIDRTYIAGDCRKTCPPLSSLELSSDQPITARLTLVVPNDAYYVMVEDSIPAGMEILNRSLKTSQQGTDADTVEIQFDDSDPFAEGWGWWLFHTPQIRDDGILFTADHLPAGTYVLTYTLIPLQAGEYRVLPAHAWETFFPEVQGTSAGAVFEIKP